MTWQLMVKVLVTVAVVVAVSEVGKRSTFWGAVLASLPLTSILAFVWLYVETGHADTVAALSRSIFWLVLPSLPLFLLLPAMLRIGWTFWPSLFAACILTVGAYFGMVWLVGRSGIRL
jgi:hypothetical protein